MTYNRKHEVKSWLYALLGVVVGATGAFFWMQDSAPEQFTFKTNEQAFHEINVSPMKPGKAHEYFTRYQGTNPSDPRGILKTENGGTVKVAEGMFIDKALVFDQLDRTAAQPTQGKDLVGYYIVFAEEHLNQHRMLFMGVYEENNELHLMLPLTPDDESCIYDWIMPCPEACPVEAKDKKLWDENNWWKRPEAQVDSTTTEE